eukprot:1086291_1
MVVIGYLKTYENVGRIIVWIDDVPSIKEDIEYNPEDNENVHLIDALGDQRTSQNVIYCFVQNCTRFNEGSTLYLHVMILKSERLLNKFKLSFVCTVDRIRKDFSKNTPDNTHSF